MTGAKELLTAGVKQLLTADALNKALFAHPNNAEVTPMDLDNAGEEEGP